ncbi:Chromosome partition protein Smc [Frankliniella fusca]|uniref:Chromosome partition protein Smc n=1 Tax=Frankliniella fusca TaxID=407009 RepID=A0AAE1HGH0_9NEOP|nr:Chromosome partition protein Smc [Frankliniella fusca]
MRHRRPSDEVVIKFTNLFKQGHSPSSALNTHKFDLQEEYGSGYIIAAGDGSLCPTLKWCFYMYKKLFSKTYGAQDGLKMMESLEEFISNFNIECGSECAKYETSKDGDYIVAICTPLMKRVHKLIQGSGEIAFVDSSGGMDRHMSRVFLIRTPSVAGALPLEDAFYGKGLKGPSIFMTDDSTAERNTLRALFPDAWLLLCIFHVLQAVWRWLLDSKHKVEMRDRPVLYDLFKDLLNANVVQLFHFLTTRLDKYFERRIVAFVNNRVENYVKSRYHVKEEKLIPLSATKDSEYLYTVTNSESKKTYSVNMEVEMCTCPIGITGAPCKEAIVYQLIADPNFKLPDEWFLSLRSGQVDPFAAPVSPPECNEDCDVTESDSPDQELNPPLEVAGVSKESEATPSDIAERVAVCLGKIDNFSDFLKHKYNTRSDLYLTAVEKMMDRFENECKTDSAAVSAIHTFNRHSNPNAVRQVNNIPIQVTALSRQKYSLGAAKNLKITGRPPDRIRLVGEHGYSTKTSSPENFTAPRPTSKLPHCISQRVATYAYSTPK